MLFINLSLYSAAAAALDESLYLINGNAVEIIFDRMLEAGSRYGKFYRILHIITGEQAVNKPRAEGVAAAYAVNYMHGIFFGEISLFSVIKHSRPVVIICGDALTQSDSYLFTAETLGKLLCDINVTLAIELAAVHIIVVGLYAEYLVGIFLVCNADIDILHQLAHDLARLFARPEILAEIEVATYLDSLCAACLDCIEADFGNIVAQRGSDACEMEPYCIRQYLVPIEILAACHADGTVLSVIDNL